VQYVICYDLSDAVRRRRVASALPDFGRRVQESVFVAHLDDYANKSSRLWSGKGFPDAKGIETRRPERFEKPSLLAIIRRRIFLNLRRGRFVPGNAVQFGPEMLQVVIGHGMNEQFFK
jgi:hypothetical protein